VNDTSTGGPHWGSFDNFTLTSIGLPKPGGGTFMDTHAVTRLAFANYFVARTGVDGNHKVCMLNVDPKTGDMRYDNSFIDETLGTPCITFNRRDWPGGATRGYYKPHAMLFVENDPPLSGVTKRLDGSVSGYWGSEIDGGSDTGGYPYAS